MNPMLPIIGIMCSIFILALSMYLLAKHDENDIITISVVNIFISIVIFVLMCLSCEMYENSIISKHTDHDKTRAIKENGKTKELYVTIDGEEYHFVFEENNK